MSDQMPKRIWATFAKSGSVFRRSWTITDRGNTEYVRADLAQKLFDALWAVKVDPDSYPAEEVVQQIDEAVKEWEEK